MNRHEAAIDHLEKRLEEALEEANNWKDYAEALLDDLNSSRTTIEALRAVRKWHEALRERHAALKERHAALLKVSQEQAEEIAKLRQHRSEALDSVSNWREAALKQADRANELSEALEQAKEEAMQQRRHLEQRIAEWRRLAMMDSQTAMYWRSECMKLREQRQEY